MKHHPDEKQGEEQESDDVFQAAWEVVSKEKQYDAQRPKSNSNQAYRHNNPASGSSRNPTANASSSAPGSRSGRQPQPSSGQTAHTHGASTDAKGGDRIQPLWTPAPPVAPKSALDHDSAMRTYLGEWKEFNGKVILHLLNSELRIRDQVPQPADLLETFARDNDVIAKWLKARKRLALELQY